MKRFISILLFICLVCGCAAAGADEMEEMEWFESSFGFTLSYPAERMEVYTQDWEGFAADCFYPVAEDPGSDLFVCRGSRFTNRYWETEDWRRLSVDEPDADLSFPFSLLAYTDGETIVEEWVVSAADADFSFLVFYDQGDRRGWAHLCHQALESLEFPFQPAVTDEFRVDFFQGGAAGMEFIDVVQDEEAAPIVLSPLQNVTDFSLEYMQGETWDDDVLMLYTADEMRPGEHLRVSIYLGEFEPDLRIRYTDFWGQDHCWYISESGRDGSLLFLSEQDL